MCLREEQEQDPKSRQKEEKQSGVRKALLWSSGWTFHSLIINKRFGRSNVSAEEKMLLPCFNREGADRGGKRDENEGMRTRECRREGKERKDLGSCVIYVGIIKSLYAARTVRVQLHSLPSVQTMSSL